MSTSNTYQLGGTTMSIAQDYKKEPLRATEFMRYPNYHQALQQKIASTGAAPYLEVDAGGAPMYQAPNLADLTVQSNRQNARYTSHMEIQLQEASAMDAYNRFFTMNQLAGNNVQNVVNWQVVNEVQERSRLLGYNQPVEDSKQRYLSDSLQRAAKDLQSMQKAVGAVFEWVLATVDATLGNRVIALQARTGAGFSPHTNLIDSVQMLTREMAGNPQGSREQCWELINKASPATTVGGVRFVIDMMCSVWTVI